MIKFNFKFPYLKKFIIKIIPIFIILYSIFFIHASVFAQQTDWPMNGANPQRTSHNSVEIPGNLNPVWYRPIDPYIDNKVQLIAADNKVFISTSKGLYAYNAQD